MEISTSLLDSFNHFLLQNLSQKASFGESQGMSALLDSFNRLPLPNLSKKKKKKKKKEREREREKPVSENSQGK